MLDEVEIYVRFNIFYWRQERPPPWPPPILEYFAGRIRKTISLCHRCIAYPSPKTSNATFTLGWCIKWNISLSRRYNIGRWKLKGKWDPLMRCLIVMIHVTVSLGLYVNLKLNCHFMLFNSKIKWKFSVSYFFSFSILNWGIENMSALDLTFIKLLRLGICITKELVH